MATGSDVGIEDASLPDVAVGYHDFAGGTLRESASQAAISRRDDLDIAERGGIAYESTGGSPLR